MTLPHGRRAVVLPPLLLTLGVFGLSPSPLGAAPRFEVAIVEPAAGRAVFGEVEVVAEVRGGDAARVDFYFDGRRLASLDRPPWRFVIDVGENYAAHSFRVVAESRAGKRDEAVLEVAAVQVNEVVDLPLQQLYVTVSSSDGAPLPGLERDDFRVRDDGQPQQLVTFERGDVPITAVLLLDSSLSMRGPRLGAALAGARAFVSGMTPLDEASVFLISDQVIQRTPFGHGADELLAGLSGAIARGGSAINDHLYLALTELERRQGRRVVVLLSDGVDLDSLLTAGQLDPAFGRSPVLLYWIRLGADQGRVRRRSVWRDFDEHAVELTALAGLVERSGGRIFDLPDIAQAERIFREVLHELRSQYVLGYYPRNPRHDGAWREIEVTVDRKGADPRAREGYFDD